MSRIRIRIETNIKILVELEGISPKEAQIILSLFNIAKIQEAISKKI